MSEKEIDEQTAFEIAGIPTPVNAENVTPTDQVSETVEDIMDDLSDTFTADTEHSRQT